MMVAPSLAAAAVLLDHGIGVSVVNVAVIKPLDAQTIITVSAAARVVLAAENHSVCGGLGSAIAEVLAESGLGRPLRRIGLGDTFAEGSGTASYLFGKYGLSVQSIVDAAWLALGLRAPAPVAGAAPAAGDHVAPAQKSAQSTPGGL